MVMNPPPITTFSTQDQPPSRAGMPFAGFNFISDVSMTPPAGHPDVMLMQAHYLLLHYKDRLFADFTLRLPDSLHNAVRKRRAEYLASRVCVRYGLSLFGISNHVLGNDTHRAPLWPAGIGGSLSHSHQHIAVLLAPAPSDKLTGVDCEKLISPDTAREMQQMVINAREATVLQRGGLPFATALTVAFSVKESLYKAIFPRLRQFMDFSTAEIVDFAPVTGEITLKLSRDFSPPFSLGRVFIGHFQIVGDEVLSWVIAPQR